MFKGLREKFYAIFWGSGYITRGLTSAGMMRLEDAGGYRAWLDLLVAPAGTLLPNGVPKVTESFFFARHAQAADWLGVVSIRHDLTDALRLRGGHIGYSVHPEYWNRGYATQILAFALAQTDALGIGEVLLTCNERNHASARVMVKNGGVLRDVVVVAGERVARYWITRRILGL